MEICKFGTANLAYKYITKCHRISVKDNLYEIRVEKYVYIIFQ